MTERATGRFIAFGRAAFSRYQDRKLSAFLLAESAEGRKHHPRDCWCGTHGGQIGSAQVRSLPCQQFPSTNLRGTPCVCAHNLDAQRSTPPPRGHAATHTGVQQTGLGVQHGTVDTTPVDTKPSATTYSHETPSASYPAASASPQ